MKGLRGLKRLGGLYGLGGLGGLGAMGVTDYIVCFAKLSYSQLVLSHSI